jgi:hypothetical protein
MSLKVIRERYLGDESTRLRFLREARAAASVRYPNVALGFPPWQNRELLLLCVEFVEGETLEQLIRRLRRRSQVSSRIRGHRGGYLVLTF